MFPKSDTIVSWHLRNQPKLRILRRQLRLPILILSLPLPRRQGLMVSMLPVRTTPRGTHKSTTTSLKKNGTKTILAFEVRNIEV